MEVNAERDCGNMAGMTPTHLHEVLEVYRGALDEQLNGIVSGLTRLPANDQRTLADEILNDMAERVQWAREAISGA